MAQCLHTGKVLLFAGSGNDELFTTGLRSAVWDYENGEFISPFTPVDFFCAGQAFLPDGRLLVAGGTKEYDNDGHPFIGLETSYLFDPLSESWVRLASMAEGRWYPTLVTLGDGRIFTVSGGPNRAEVYSSVTGWVQMPVQEGWPVFPQLLLMRDGRLILQWWKYVSQCGRAAGTARYTHQYLNQNHAARGLQSNQRPQQHYLAGARARAAGHDHRRGRSGNKYRLYR